MKIYLRNLFRSQPFLFKLWFKIYRSKRGLKIKWFDEDSKIYFDGYPRSGNTFLAHLMRAIYDDKKIIHHFHTVAPLKIALKREIRSIIIIRDPKEALSSNYLKKYELKKLPETVNLRLLQMMINDYIIYYTFIYGNLNKIHLVQFEKLINSPENVLLEIDNYLDNYSGINDDKKLYDLIRRRKKMKFGAKSRLGSSLPSKEKEILKTNIKNEIFNLSGIKEANYLFNELIKNKD